MNEKFGIKSMQKVILFKEWSNNILEKDSQQKNMLTKKSIYLLKHVKHIFLTTEIHRVSLAKSKSQFMRKMLHTNPIFKLVKMSNHFRQQYYSQISIRLLSSSTNPNRYREILTYIKKFLNNKKIPCVAPLSIITNPFQTLWINFHELFC